MNEKPDIWIVRHGPTEWSDAGRHTSRTDLPLTAEGQRAAAALYRPLDRQRFALVFTSPRLRACDTARLAGFANAAVDDDLVEWDYGEHEGHTTDEIREGDPEWTIFDGGVPGGETVVQVAARAVRVLDRVHEADGPVLLFSHGHFLRVLTAVALELGPRAGAQFVLDPATISIIGTERRTRALTLWNEPAGRA